MGGCGCGDGFGDWRFPARDGGWYTVRFYHACDECETPYGLLFEHFKPGGDCPVEKLCDEREWSQVSETHASTQIAFLHPRRLHTELGKALVGFIDEAKRGEWDGVPPEEIAEALLGDSLSEAVVATTEDDWM